MDYSNAKILINKSVGNLIRNIINTNFKDIEKIDGDIRLIIDLEIILFEIKNNLITIIDFLIDKFKIIDRDELMRIFIIHLFSEQTKKCVLKISKFVPIAYFSESKNANDLIKIAHNYLTEKIIDCIFNPYMIDSLIDLSNNNSEQFRFIIKNWKIIIAIILTIFILIIFKKIAPISRFN
jgi:hypothetical protein